MPNKTLTIQQVLTMFAHSALGGEGVERQHAVSGALDLLQVLRIIAVTTSRRRRLCWGQAPGLPNRRRAHAAQPPCRVPTRVSC